MQILSYTNNDKLRELSQIKYELEERIISRKPTDKQHKKGYSKSNLKYLYAQDKEVFEKNEKAKLNAVKLFGNVETAKKLLS